MHAAARIEALRLLARCRGALGDRRERVAGDVHCLQEVLLTRVDVTALEFFLVGVSNGVDYEVDPVPGVGDCGERGI